MRSVLFVTIPLVLMLAISPAADAKKKKKKKKKPKTTTSKSVTLPGKKLDLGSVAAAAPKGPSREKLDAAIRLVKSGSLGDGACQLYDISRDQADFEDEAKYNLAKALYRMGHYQSALEFFSSLLAKGPKTRFYESSLEWCLFLSRKMVHHDSVNEVVAQYSTGDFPSAYRDEFLFRLARYHYTRALFEEIDSESAETKVRETETGAKSLSGDLFGDDGADTPPPEDDTVVEKKDGGGLSIGEDLFGEDPAPKPEEKKPEVAPVKAPEAAKPGQLTPKEHMEQAGKLALRVSPESKFGARSKFLEALVQYRGGDPNRALESFKAVVRLAKPGSEQADEKLRQLAFFQLARTHFGANQPSFSIFYYDKIDRDEYAWLDALYEGSWAEFRLGNFEKALGNLLTLHSPFFQDGYYPESHILKAVIYYENCRYPEAKDFLTDFLRRYEPVLEELKKLTARNLPPDQYYEVLDNLRSDETAGSDSQKAVLVSQVLGLALSDPDLGRLDAAYQEVDQEVKAISGGAFPSCSLTPYLEEKVGKVRAKVARAAGRAVKRKLEQEKDLIKDLIQQAIRIDIETSRAEQERIEATLRQGESAPSKREQEFVEWTDDEKEVWPFTGEYWRDELGTYELTLAQTCQTRGMQQ